MSATPGPWTHTAVAGGWDGVRDDSGAVICTLSLNNPDNARLLAAAPELIAAVKGTLAYDVPLRAGLLAQLQAAVAKAEGTA